VLSSFLAEPPDDGLRLSRWYNARAVLSLPPNLNPTRNINHLAGLRVDKYHNLKDSLFPRPGLVLTKPQTTRDY
jgi:hypothetical protein